jgi:hypothetical protein
MTCASVHGSVNPKLPHETWAVIVIAVITQLINFLIWLFILCFRILHKTDKTDSVVACNYALRYNTFAGLRRLSLMYLILGSSSAQGLVRMSDHIYVPVVPCSELLGLSTFGLVALRKRGWQYWHTFHRLTTVQYYYNYRTAELEDLIARLKINCTAW